MVTFCAPAHCSRRDPTQIRQILLAFNGHEQVGGALLDAGSDPNMTRLPNGEAALHMACQNGHLKCTQRLIGAGANVELVRDDGCTSLMTAAANGHEECVDAVLKDAVLNPRSTRCSPRLCALRKILLVDMADKYGETALISAVRGGHEKCVRALIEAGSDTNKANIGG
jgi:ankyrin repeat protein